MLQQHVIYNSSELSNHNGIGRIESSFHWDVRTQARDCWIAKIFMQYHLGHIVFITRVFMQGYYIPRSYWISARL